MRDDKFVWLAKLVNVALLVHLVGLLVVDEQVGGALACHPLVQQGFVRLLLEGLLHKIQIVTSCQLRGPLREGQFVAPTVSSAPELRLETGGGLRLSGL